MNDAIAPVIETTLYLGVEILLILAAVGAWKIGKAIRRCWPDKLKAEKKKPKDSYKD